MVRPVNAGSRRRGPRALASHDAPSTRATKAASAGDDQGMLDLGELYLRGDGVKQDVAQARAWFVRSAAAGNTVAEKALARLNSDKR